MTDTHPLLQFFFICRCSEPVVNTEIPDKLIALRALVERCDMRFPTLASGNLGRSWWKHKHRGRGGEHIVRRCGLFIQVYNNTQPLLSGRLFVPITWRHGHSRQTVVASGLDAPAGGIPE